MSDSIPVVNAAVSYLSIWRDVALVAIPATITAISILVPKWVDARKEKALADQLFAREAKREVVESLSVFSGAVTAYLDVQLTRYMMDYVAEGREDQFKQVSSDLLSAEVRLKKAKALSGMLGCKSLLGVLDRYDSAVSALLNSFKDIGDVRGREPSVDLKAFKALETEVWSALEQL